MDRRSRISSALLVFAVCGAFSALLVAEIVDFSADTVKYKLSSPKRIDCLGRAVISNAENVIHADKIVITGPDLDVAKCYKNVHIVSKDSGADLTSDFVEFYQTSDYVRLLKRPVLVMKDLRIVSDDMERYTARKFSVIQGDTVITRSNLDARCWLCNYDENKEMVVLKGSPSVRFRKETGEALRNEFTCGEIIFFNTNNRLILNRNVKGRIFFDE